MFTLTINSRQLILDPGFGVPLLYKNPCWCFNEIPGPLALDVSIPDNDVNRNYLGFPGRFAKIAKSNDRKFPGAELRWRGYLYIYGTLVITNASEKGYAGYIQSELRSLSDSQREKLIGDHNLLGELTFENKPDYDPDTDLYCTIRLNNAGFWVDKGKREPYTDLDGNATEREILTRKFEDTVGFEVNYTVTGGVLTAAGVNGVVVVSPFPFLHKLIELLLRDNQFFMRNYFIQDNDDLKTLCLYHNTSICRAYGPSILASITKIDYHALVTGNVGTIPGLMIQSQLWLTDQFMLKKLLPKLELNELLLSVQNLTNTFFHFSGINDVDNIDRESLFDMQSFNLSKYRISRWLPGKRQNLILKFKFDHDPDDQEFNENFTDISSREADIQDPVTVYADLVAIAEPAISEIRLVTSEKMYYEYRQETTDDEDGNSIEALMWAPISIDLQDYKYNPSGDDTEEIQTKFSTLRMHTSGYPIGYQKGNNIQFSQFTENFSPRLLFYNGNNTGGVTTPSGLTIDWKSIVPRRYRRTAAFYANALPVEANFRFPGNIFYKVLNEIYKPYLDHDGSFFIKEMQVEAGNSEFVDATLTVFKNEDNVFVAAPDIVEGGGEHAGGALFVPMFVGVTEYGAPILVDAAGLTRPMPVFGNLSDADYAEFTCVAYSPDDKLLFVGGNSGQLHVCDLSDMDNIRYKTISVFGVMNVTGVSLVDNGTTKTLLIGYGNGSAAWAQPYHAVWADYVSSEAVQTASFDHGTGHLRGFIYYGGYYHAVTRDGEVFRTASLSTMWSQVADIAAEFIAIAETATHLYVAEVNEDGLYCEKTNTAQYYRTGLVGSPYQKERTLQPLLGDNILFINADDNACIFIKDVNTASTHITPAGIKNAGGACFDATKYAYISVRDSSGYTKIAKYNAELQIPEALWSYLNVSAFFTKLWLY
ncbi:MAG TPA: hypothetical protein DCR40_10320 [Prolixibacteraceae bacterium]|nr:hypothetical protein [Prolixibacteraceae bacterium]